MVEEALKALPIPKVMRWGAGEAQFVRPVHGLVMLHGESVVPGTVLGLQSGNRTRGHRFMGDGEIALAAARTNTRRPCSARAGDRGLRATPRPRSTRSCKRVAARRKAALGEYQDLLDEVTALVEHPSVYVGELRRGVPRRAAGMPDPDDAAEPEVFPAVRRRGQAAAEVPDRLQHEASPTRATSSAATSAWCGRGSRTRASSTTRTARRGWRRASPQLGKVVYHNKLGSQLERVQRVKLLAGKIARAARAPTRCRPSARRSSPRPTCSPAWSASFRSCRA